MDILKLKYENLSNAMDRLNEAISYLKKLDSQIEKQAVDFLENEDLRRSLRDSLIQRFEFSVDLFWKYIKKYLELQLNEPSEFNTPKSVIKSACKTKIISEKDAELIIEMIKCRNLTSHIYKEELSDKIASQIPVYYEVMKKYLDKLIS